MFYQWLWIIYGVAAIGLIMSAWYGLRRVKPVMVQDILMLFLVALLMTPVTAVPDGLELAPALIVWLLEALVFSDPAGWRGAGLILGVFLILTALLFLKYWLVKRYFSGDARPASESSREFQSAPEL